MDRQKMMGLRKIDTNDGTKYTKYIMKEFHKMGIWYQIFIRCSPRHISPMTLHAPNRTRYLFMKTNAAMKALPPAEP